MLFPAISIGDHCCISRYIEVFETNSSDMERARRQFGAGGSGGRGGGDRGRDRDHRGGRFVLALAIGDCTWLSVYMALRSRGYVVKLNGLPFRASEREVEDWLAEAADPVEVIIEMDRLAVTRIWTG